MISNSTIFNYTNGINLEGNSSNICIINCTFYSNSYRGIYLNSENTGYSLVTGNNIFGPGQLHGIHIGNGDNFVISNNDICENIRGLCICRDCQNINISHNSIYNNVICGFYIYKSSNNIFFKNNLNNNNCGIIISRSEKNTIIKNTVSSCKQFGIHIYYSSGNIVENNNFISNFICAIFTYCINRWNGNYWNIPIITIKVIPGFWKIRNLKGSEMIIPWLNFDWHPTTEPYDIQ